MKNDMLLALSRQKCKGGARREESELLSLQLLHTECFTLGEDWGLERALPERRGGLLY